jgi:glycosyltransferase involved in cell wall biosynthesis
MVGNYTPDVLNRLKETNNPNLLILNAVPHRELSGIYRALDYGLILYRGVDVNFEFCAPNKLYEYWSNGIPVVAHRLQGLLPVFDHPLKGQLFDFDSENAVVKVAELLQQGKTEKPKLKKLFGETLDIELSMQPVKNIIAQWAQ